MATFQYDFPYVYVGFEANLDDDNKINTFLETWNLIYAIRKPYVMIFDTRTINYINPKYTLHVRRFIRKIKKYSPQYLQYSIIISESSMIKNLLHCIFTIQKPAAPVYMCKSEFELLETHQRAQSSNSTSNSYGDFAQAKNDGTKHANEEAFLLQSVEKVVEESYECPRI